MQNPYEPSTEIDDSVGEPHRLACPICDTTQEVLDLLNPWGRCCHCKTHVSLRLSGSVVALELIVFLAAMAFGYRFYVSREPKWLIDNLSWVSGMAIALPPLGWFASFMVLLRFGHTCAIAPKRFRPYNATEVAELRKKFLTNQ